MNVRHFLHAHPELSGREKHTHDYIVKYLTNLHPNFLAKHVGGYGIIASFYGKKQGKNIAFRADIDALPINDEINNAYKSHKVNIGHKCGHDGHIAILLTVADIISHNRQEYGNIILIFQPEEETGNGAQKIIDSGILDKEHVDYIFGLHNLPGYPIGSIIVKDNTFAAASCGLIAELTGIQTHAAYPENGINPGLTVGEIIKYLDDITTNHRDTVNFQQATLIYSRIGEIAFGTSAGDAEIMTTLRAYSNNDMKLLINNTVNKISEICKQKHIFLEYRFQDEFSAVENQKEYVDFIRSTANYNGYNLIEISKPFRWSEDFSNYLKKYKGAFFGIGDGIDHAELHSPLFDFPDDIIDTTALFDVKLADYITQSFLVPLPHQQ